MLIITGAFCSRWRCALHTRQPGTHINVWRDECPGNGRVYTSPGARQRMHSQRLRSMCTPPADRLVYMRLYELAFITRLVTILARLRTREWKSACNLRSEWVRMSLFEDVVVCRCARGIFLHAGGISLFPCEPGLNFLSYAHTFSQNPDSKKITQIWFYNLNKS
jgi:hypothetical protein